MCIMDLSPNDVINMFYYVVYTLTFIHVLFIFEFKIYTSKDQRGKSKWHVYLYPVTLRNVDFN